ncbi:hypothetical protein B0A55_12760 [Friedmanniomyces simplex]|uniref:Uncharacterized protein n=1 Tax=Friedmanniomyces simplex TaxID=329884 RepID=A0A4U0VKM1_9PEZI|nr:hypothetical protein B0A55_12760 [Friedmanniomyces simplex]
MFGEPKPFDLVTTLWVFRELRWNVKPTFFLKASTSGAKHQQNFFLSHHGSEPAPAYVLQHADPASLSPAHKNCYAAALFDSYNPEILFGEVLARPGWTQPTLSQEEIKRNGGVPPPPQPILPNGFVIQLYNPDQQVRVELKEGKWGGSDHYEFSMPIATFRTPSASNLDRGQSDPASLAITPKVHFAWRKESKLGKDLTCFMTGKSTDPKEKKKSKRDPDIAIALWRSMRELTVYEPNLSRVDIEDPKGLEIVLLLSAVVIKDLYFGNRDNMRETFNISGLPSERKLSGGGRKLSNPQQTFSIVGAPNPLHSHPPQPAAPVTRTPNEHKRTALPTLQTMPPIADPPRQRRAPPPIADPRAQWELDAETARLKAQAEAEAREEQQRRRNREKADELEAKRLQKQIEEEDRQARRKHAEVDRETDRLRKKYGVQAVPQRPGPPPQSQSSSSRSSNRSHHMQPIPQGSQMNLGPPQPQPRMGSNGLYMQPSGGALVMSGANGNPSLLNVNKPVKPKKSFFGLRSASDDGAVEGSRLRKKSSAMW